MGSPALPKRAMHYPFPMKKKPEFTPRLVEELGPQRFCHRKTTADS